MRDSFLEKALALNQNEESYATALIVRRKAPSSGKPGDKAIITTEGKIYGWIGGCCTHGIVLKEALESIRDRKPRFVSIRPEAGEQVSYGNTKHYTMTCQSGGEVEVYIEPVIPKPHLLIFGNSHIAMALAKIASAMDYRIHVVMSEVDKTVFPTADKLIPFKEFDEAADYQKSYVVVCTQGEGDAEALAKALSLGSSFVGFVASRKKANSIYQEVRMKGVSMDELSNIRTPAEIDIGAKLPEEVAISILAEIIQAYRTNQEKVSSEKEENLMPNDDYYFNPVCNIPIQKSTAKYVLEYNNEKVYFCCDGCKVKFEKEPEKFMAETADS